MALIIFSYNNSSCYNLAFVAFSSEISPCKEILREGIPNSSGIMASSLYTNENGVALVAIWTLVLYAPNAYGNCSCQFFLYLSHVLERMLLIVLFVTST